MSDKTTSEFLTCRHLASRRAGAVEYLERSPQQTEVLTEALPAELATKLHEAGALLKDYYETDFAELLDKAAGVIHSAYEKMPEDDPHLGATLSSYEAIMDAQLVGTGVVDSRFLDSTVKIAERALCATPLGHPCRATRGSNLSIWKGRRYEWHSYPADLDMAIEKSELAVADSSADGTSRAGICNNLGYWLGRRFDRSQCLPDLDRAVEVTEQAVEKTACGDPLFAVRLNNLAVRLHKRFKESRDGSDIDRAIQVTHTAIEAPGIIDVDRPLLLANLGKSYLARSQHVRLSSRSNIDQAISHLQKAVEEAATTCHPDHADFLLSLGNCLVERHEMEKTSEMTDILSALDAYQRGWACPRGRTGTRVHLARRAAEILALKKEWAACSTLLEEAVGFLPFVCLPLQMDSTRQEVLSEFQGLAAEAAAASLESGKDAYHALNLLESGSSMSNGVSFDLDAFSSMKELRCPEIWDFGFERDKLDKLMGYFSFPAPKNATHLWEAHIAQELAIRGKLESLIRKVRSYPQCRSFLQAHSLENIQVEATVAPMVVLNASSHRCDALIIDDTGGVRNLRLPELTLSGITQRSQDLRFPSRIAPTLEWLWNVAARDILTSMGFTSAASASKAPRVFWVLPGAASHLPMHAAGYHVPESTDTVLDRVMSSYSSSVKSLIYCRHRDRTNFKNQKSDGALLISMEQTESLEDLPSAPIEVAAVSQLCPPLGLRPMVQSTPCYSDVRKQFKDCEILHFAGHGRSGEHNPLESCLCLKDWITRPLTADRLMMSDFRIHTKSPFLAYLSACSTGAIEQGHLVDEGPHLIGVLQLSGFRHVIGSLSPVPDLKCVDMARIFYETLGNEGLSDWAVCRGLHCAIMTLRYSSHENADVTGQSDIEGHRDGRVPGRRAHDFFWVPYVHFGV